MRVVFAGSPEFSVPCLRILLDAGGIDVIAVYTQPDRGAGRGRQITSGPVKECALGAGIPIFQPETLRNPEQQEILSAMSPDLMVVVAFGQILPQRILDIPKLDCVNLHASLLPRWRGAAPIQRAIAAGDKATGISLMQMEAGLDTGPVLDQCETPIHPTDRGGSLHDRLAVLSANLLEKNLVALSRGELVPRPQDDEKASYAPRIVKGESELDFTRSAEALERQVRAFDPWPGTTARLHGQSIRIASTRTRNDPDREQPGTIVRAGNSGILVQTGKGQVEILKLQKPGGRVLRAGEFLNGNPLDPGSVFEVP